MYVITKRSDVPEIWYFDKHRKLHRHFVDIYIPKLNKCIEVKSEWTLQRHGDLVFRKQNAGLKMGYEYVIWLYDKRGNFLYEL